MEAQISMLEGLKARQTIAQGNALGTGFTKDRALKGRHNRDPLTGILFRLSGLKLSRLNRSQGVALGVHVLRLRRYGSATHESPF